MSKSQTPIVLLSSSQKKKREFENDNNPNSKNYQSTTENTEKKRQTKSKDRSCFCCIRWNFVFLFIACLPVIVEAFFVILIFPWLVVVNSMVLQLLETILMPEKESLSSAAERFSPTLEQFFNLQILFILFILIENDTRLKSKKKRQKQFF